LIPPVYSYDRRSYDVAGDTAVNDEENAGRGEAAAVESRVYVEFILLTSKFTSP